MRTFLPFLSGFLTLALSTAPFAQTIMGDKDEGYALAKKTCAECHRIGKAEAAPKLYPATAFQTIADNPAATELSLRVFLKSPHRDMPNLILTDSEIDNLIAYILGLR